MSTEVCRFLRPCLHQGIRWKPNPAYARFFSAYSKSCTQQPSKALGPGQTSGDYKKRLAQLQSYASLEDCYPRLRGPSDRVQRLHVDTLKSKAECLEPDQTDDSAEVVVSGRVLSVRAAGSKLVFVDLEQDGKSIQAICNFGRIEKSGITKDSFNAFKHVMRKGDWFSFVGNAHKSPRGEQSILVNELPRLESPSLHQLPERLDDAETRARRPHVDMLVNHEVVQTLKMRSHIERILSSFLDNKGFHKVNTPLLTAGAGGAVARPFETTATEMENTALNLRIAPELWLKRLVAGGMGRVYEIGPAFRNEGVDATHNPEFTICEFYMPFAELEGLMALTESLLSTLQKELRTSREELFDALTDSITKEEDFFAAPFPRLPFIQTIEANANCKLPDLSAPDATEAILRLFAEKNIHVPAKPTLPRLLDELAAHYIEPLCTNPTFITHHPAVTSPLSKSFLCPATNQLVAARAELFIRGHEYANMYEEENSPFEQRRKFEEQLAYRAVDGESDGRAEVDESYLEALEWGLPPTGGWGMGIDRLVMLFAGRKRIGDVLPFGTLRNVVGLATRQK